MSFFLGVEGYPDPGVRRRQETSVAPDTCMFNYCHICDYNIIPKMFHVKHILEANWGRERACLALYHRNEAAPRPRLPEACDRVRPSSTSRSHPLYSARFRCGGSRGVLGWLSCGLGPDQRSSHEPFPLGAVSMGSRTRCGIPARSDSPTAVVPPPRPIVFVRLPSEPARASTSKWSVTVSDKQLTYI